MWKLNRITARNLCAFQELDYQLQQKVTTLIFGNNLDNESQRSNGSGKSALIECIAVALTGSPLRKIKNEEIINDNAEECCVNAQFVNDSCNEMFTIERRLFRKTSATVTCTIERDGETVETDEAVQATVEAYNRYILEKLGITKDELFNNFLLSKFKFQDFLSSSDREKKEIINRFSNGIVVDNAIEKLSEDIGPVQEELRKADLEIAGIDGRIEMLVEQIAGEENNRAEKMRTRKERIVSMQQTISTKRELIRQKEEESKEVKDFQDKLKGADTSIQALENEEHSLESCLTGIRTILSPLGIVLSDWEKIIERKHTEQHTLENKLAQWDKELENAEKKVDSLTTEHNRLRSEYQTFTVSYALKTDSYDKRLVEIQQEISGINSEAGELRKNKRILSTAIEEIRARLAGTITCPKCEYKFLVSDSHFDVASGLIDLKDRKTEFENVSSRITECENNAVAIEKSQEELRNDKRALNSQNSDWEDCLERNTRQIRAASGELEMINSSHKKVKDDINSLLESIESICKRVFDETFDLIDDNSREKQRKAKSLQEEKQTAKGSIETLEEAIKELNTAPSSGMVDSLKASLKVYRKKSSEAVLTKSDIDKRMQRLEEQQQRFVRFKSYLANTKIEALSTITNEFLENIGSDIRVKFSGYTILKTGKLREKISVSLIRDGIDLGSFGKFSAGEAARVNLATILAMQKLINSNCELDKGLDLLVLDEILEAVDEDGLSSMFNALNALEITALVVSHGNISESYPHKLVITKEHGYSTINPEDTGL